jgi:hypothetical protein
MNAAAERLYRAWMRRLQDWLAAPQKPARGPLEGR